MNANIAEFIGTALLILFGNGVVADVVRLDVQKTLHLLAGLNAAEMRGHLAAKEHLPTMTTEFTEIDKQGKR